MVYVPQAEALRRSQELATEQGVTCNAVGTQETEKSFVELSKPQTAIQKKHFSKPGS